MSTINRLDFTISAPTHFQFTPAMSSSLTGIRIASENTSSISPFIASPRTKAAWTAGDYFNTALKILFFPITAIYYLLNYLCSKIAYSFGVGATNQVDTLKRDELKRLGGQEVAFITEDKVQIEGMYFNNPRPERSAQTILICSGSHASYEKHTVPMVDALQKLGHHVMVFNYRGFGKSAGSPSEEGFNLDVEAAYQYLQSVKGKSDHQITVWGYSMGTAPATGLAVNHRVKLVLDRYFSSMKDVAHDNGGLIANWIFHLGGAGFDIKEKIKQVQGQIFLARGSYDTTMKPYHEEHLRSSLGSNGRASFVSVDSPHLHNSNMGLWFHSDNIANNLHRAHLQRFLQS